MSRQRKLGDMFSRNVDKRVIFMVAGLLMATVPKGWSSEVVLVKIYVDEEEATNEATWRHRLTNRLNAASDVIAQHTDVRFAVIDYGRWESDNRLQDLSKSLREFEQEVMVGRERIAIGFSSQYKFQPGRNNLGGTRGPMRSHILIRENARPVLETERLEVLVHELGHFLCAGHSGSPDSVMRPVIGDGQARATTFRITFDPINSKILRLVGSEMRDRHVKEFHELSPHALVQLQKQYAQLAKQLPDDDTAYRYLRFISAILQAKEPDQDPSKILVPSDAWPSSTQRIPGRESRLGRQQRRQ